MKVKNNPLPSGLNSNTLLISDAQRWLQSQAQLFSQVTGYPKDLVTGAFIWKLHRLKNPAGSVDVNRLKPLCHVTTLQEYWVHRDPPNKYNMAPLSNGEKWIARLTGQSYPPGHFPKDWTESVTVTLQDVKTHVDTVISQSKPYSIKAPNKLSTDQASSFGDFSVEIAKQCPVFPPIFLKHAFFWNHARSAPEAIAARALSDFWGSSSAVQEHWLKRLVRNAALQALLECRKKLIRPALRQSISVQTMEFNQSFARAFLSRLSGDHAHAYFMPIRTNTVAYLEGILCC